MKCGYCDSEEWPFIKWIDKNHRSYTTWTTEIVCLACLMKEVGQIQPIVAALAAGVSSLATEELDES